MIYRFAHTPGSFRFAVAWSLVSWLKDGIASAAARQNRGRGCGYKIASATLKSSALDFNIYGLRQSPRGLQYFIVDTSRNLHA